MGGVLGRAKTAHREYYAISGMTVAMRDAEGIKYLLTGHLGYDAENRLVSVSGAMTASFAYDGDGKRVRSTIGSTTTYFIGNIYELTGETATKYYYAGATRFAMRVDTADPYYLLSDHLGSTTVTTDASGNFVTELRYSPWGEVRSGTAPTSYTFTGQYSNVSDFGLMYYNARWMDPSLGRFAQADSIVPDGVQGYDRYAYANNSPVNYTDPSGHAVECGITPGGTCKGVGPLEPTLVRDQNGISGAAHLGLPPESAANGLTNVWNITTGIYSVLLEPVDWVISGAECAQGRCSVWMLAGLLPFVPSSVGRYGDDIADAARRADVPGTALRINGETAATRNGRAAHTSYPDLLGDYSLDYNRSMRGSKLRPDAIDYVNRIVRELKPNTASGLARGLKQLDRYVDELMTITGEQWVGILDLY
jgi:RHS repeat-associated protein